MIFYLNLRIINDLKKEYKTKNLLNSKILVLYLPIVILVFPKVYYS